MQRKREKKCKRRFKSTSLVLPTIQRFKFWEEVVLKTWPWRHIFSRHGLQGRWRIPKDPTVVRILHFKKPSHPCLLGTLICYLDGCFWYKRNTIILTRHTKITLFCNWTSVYRGCRKHCSEDNHRLGPPHEKVSSSMSHLQEKGMTDQVGARCASSCSTQRFLLL